MPTAFAQKDASLATKNDSVKTVLPMQSWAELTPKATSLSAGTAKRIPSSMKTLDKHDLAIQGKASAIDEANLNFDQPNYNETQFDTHLTSEFPKRQWWLKFSDSNLEDYITEAIQNSPRLEASLERIKQARAQVSITFAKQLPSLNFNPQYLRAGLPNNIAGLALPNSIQAFILSFAPSYEVDLFGKNRNRTQSSKQELAAVELDNKALLVSLEGEVAAAYFNLLRADELLYSQEKNLIVLKQINELKHLQYDAGLANYDEVDRSERDVAQALTSINDYQQQQALFAHQLAVLVGRPAEAQGHLLRGTLTQIILPAETETGIPSDLVLHRPDIMASERRLKRAAIDVKVARKAFLPTVNLSAMFSTAGQRIGDVINTDNFADIELAQISQPIFQGGRLVGESKYQKARMREQMLNYRQSLLVAIREVEDQLAILKSSYKNINANSQRLELTQHSLYISELQERQGVVPRLTVLIGQSEMNQYQQLNTNSKANVLIATVNLFKALGGGY
jgi:multidrug efflux system outer membrane protein